MFAVTPRCSADVEYVVKNGVVRHFWILANNRQKQYIYCLFVE